MIRIKSTVLFFALAISAAPALAGPLAVDTNSYLGIWHSSTPYQGYNDPPFNTDPSGLTGFVDWAVYAPGQFPVGFTGLAGWTPDPTHFVYAYQAYETGTAALTSLFVDLFNPGVNIGEFTGDGGFGDVGTGATGADFAQIVPMSTAEWYWFAGIPSGGNSYGLAFTSPYVPMLATGTVIDDGTNAFVVPLPTPSDQLIPEPSSFVLAAFGVLAAGLGWLRRRGRKVA
jgi:hypothetical protein